MATPIKDLPQATLPLADTDTLIVEQSTASGPRTRKVLTSDLRSTSEDWGTLSSGKQVKRRRGTTAQHVTFTGAVGEVTVDTDKDVVVVHDGSTAGGFPHVRADVLAGTAAGQGSVLVGNKRSVAGAVSTNVFDELDAQTLNAVVNFGADNTGVSNATTALKAFWDACISTGKRGWIPAGTYLVTPGVLVFDTPFVDADAPVIETPGYYAVTFKAASSVDAPFITYSNGTATSGAGRYWYGGKLGGITFDQNGKATSSNQHAISLRGCWGMVFDPYVATNLGGSALSIPAALYAGANPDPYAVTACFFYGISANFCLGRVVDNQNYVGLNGCNFFLIRGIGTGLGGVYGNGAGNNFFTASLGECNGWAWDDGTQTANTGGSPSRTRVFFAEVDGCENGIRVNRQSISAFLGIRFVHRYKFSPNTTNLYWPRACLDINGGSLAGSVTQVDFQIIHRIEAAMSSSALNLVVGANPISTSNGTNVITVTTQDPHTFTNGWTVAVLNSAAVGGVPAAEINGEHVITVTGANTFTFTSTTLASSTATGGGSTISLSPLDALGAFVDAHSNASIFGVNIEQQEINNAGFTSITNDPTRLLSNVSASSSFLATRLGRAISDTRIRYLAKVRGTTTTAVNNTGYLTSTAKIVWGGTVDNDRSAIYDTTNGWVVVPRNGFARITARFNLTVAVGTRVRMGVVTDNAGALTIQMDETHYQVNAGNQSYHLNGVIPVTKGHRVWIMADQNTAGSVNMTTAGGGSALAALHFAFEMVEP